MVRGTESAERPEHEFDAMVGTVPVRCRDDSGADRTIISRKLVESIRERGQKITSAVGEEKVFELGDGSRAVTRESVTIRVGLPSTHSS